MKAPIFNAFPMTEVTELEFTVTPPKMAKGTCPVIRLTIQVEFAHPNHSGSQDRFRLCFLRWITSEQLTAFTPPVMRWEQSGWYTIRAVFEVKNEIPAESPYPWTVIPKTQEFSRRLDRRLRF